MPTRVRRPIRRRHAGPRRAFTLIELVAVIIVLAILIGVATSALFGVLAIRLLLGMLRHKGFGVFFAYRAALALGALVFWLARS